MTPAGNGPSGQSRGGPHGTRRADTRATHDQPPDGAAHRRRGRGRGGTRRARSGPRDGHERRGGHADELRRHRSRPAPAATRNVGTDEGIARRDPEARPRQVARTTVAPQHDQGRLLRRPDAEALQGPGVEHHPGPRPPRGLLGGSDVGPGPGGPPSRRVEQAAAVRGHRRLLVQPPEHREPVRLGVGQPPRLRPGGHPASRARPLRGHAHRLDAASVDALLPQQRRVDEGRPQRELRSRVPRAPHDRRRRRLRRGGHAPVDAGADGSVGRLGDRPVQVLRRRPLHRARSR